MMALSQLIRDLPVDDPLHRDLTGVLVQGLCHDSRRVEPGDLFVAWRGARHDGLRYLGDAIDRGAIAVLADRWQEAKPGTIGAAPGSDVPILVTDQPQRLLAPLALRLHDHPDRALKTVGVTGTNGKTTVTQLVAGLLEAAGMPAGVLGTLGIRFANEELGHTLALGGGRTTPEASDLVRALAVMRDRGARAAAMEVSSHSLALGRVTGLGFDVAVFTNLGRDHLDFHDSLEDYFEAKAALFAQLKPGGTSVLNVDDPFGRRLAERWPDAYTFGKGGDFELVELAVSARGIEGRVATPGGLVRIESPLVGRFHAQNLLAAIAAVFALGVELAVIESALPETGLVPGRMEPVDAGQSFPVFVDYAHTADALRAALEALRELWPGRIAIVFGCGGERDRGKRPAMGRVAAELADRVLVTDDNPRREDPAEIRRQVLEGAAGVAGPGRVEAVAGRELAISAALELAARERGWAVLVAGKGHEETQSIGGQDLPFSDHRVAREKLEALLGSSKAR